MLKLMQAYPDQPAVPSKLVDLVWHEHILDTQQYQRDTLRLFGHYVTPESHPLQPALHDATRHACTLPLRHALALILCWMQWTEGASCTILRRGRREKGTPLPTEQDAPSLPGRLLGRTGPDLAAAPGPMTLAPTLTLTHCRLQAGIGEFRGSTGTEDDKAAQKSPDCCAAR